MLKKLVIICLLVLTIFAFSMRYVSNPAFSLDQNNVFGAQYGTYFGGIYGWVTNFGLYYNEVQDNMTGRFYLLVSKDSTQNINEVGYAISSGNDTNYWGGDFKLVNYSDSATSMFLINVGLGFGGKIFDNVILGAFLEDFSVYSQYPGQLFKGNVGVDLTADFNVFDFYSSFNYIKQEYFKFDLGGSFDFDFISFGGYWSPEYYNKVGAFINKVRGFVLLKIGAFKVNVRGFYSFDNVSSSISNLIMNYENHPYGYDVIIEVKF